jgi:hypothetical protein
MKSEQPPRMVLCPDTPAKTSNLRDKTDHDIAVASFVWSQINWWCISYQIASLMSNGSNVANTKFIKANMLKLGMA